VYIFATAIGTLISKSSTIYEMNKRNSICITSEVYTKLKDKGNFGESFSELISRILDEFDYMNTQYESLRCRRNEE
jgi:hypothetical protein